MAKQYSVVGLILFLLFLSCQQNKNPLTSQPEEHYLSPFKPAPRDSIPEEDLARYQEDAAQLALREMYQDEEARENVVKIPDSLINAYLDPLLYVYLAREYPARDSVVSIYKIHVWRTVNLHEFFLRVDTSFAWTHAWLAGKSLTGNQEIDKLVKTYHLENSNKNPGNEGEYWVYLSSTIPLNLRALVNCFLEIEGVLSGGLITLYGDGWDIQATWQDDGVWLDYYLGWGDCLSGCARKHYWRFAVNFRGEVQYLGSWGDPLEEFTPTTQKNRLEVNVVPSY